MNRRLSGDSSLNAPVRNDAEGSSEWMDWLVDEEVDQETALGDNQELDQRREMLRGAMDELNEREQRIFTMRRLSEDPMTLEQLSQEFGVSRERSARLKCGPLKKCKRRHRCSS